MNPHVPLIKRWLTEHAGLESDLLARVWFDRLIERRLAVRGVDTEDAYCRLLARDEEEKQKLLREVCVNETWFFRYPTSFELLVTHLRELRRQAPAIRNLRMLSIACASGQEPYSMAMAAVQAGWPLEHLTLDAIDCNVEAIENARRAVYSSRSLRSDAPSWARRWILPEEDGLRVDSRIAASVRFIREDALTAASYLFHSPYHVVFCRNLMIYLSESARQQLVRRLEQWLVADGMLFTGHAERLELFHEHFEFIADRHTFAMRRRSSTTRPSQPSSERSHNEFTAKESVPLSNAQPVSRLTTNEASTEVAPPVSTRKSRLDEARALADLGRLPEARGALHGMREQIEPDAEFFGILGSVELALGNVPAACDALLQVLSRTPHSVDALLQLAIAYQRLGQVELADQYRRRAAQAHQAGQL